MGNENGQFREWDEKQEQDWNLLSYPRHDAFHQFMVSLNKIYLKNPAFYEKDYEKDGFEWIDCTNGYSASYAFLRKGTSQNILAVFNFSDRLIPEYELVVSQAKEMTLLLDSGWECFGGNQTQKKETIPTEMNRVSVCMEPFSAKYYIIKKSRSSGKKKCCPANR